MTKSVRNTEKPFPSSEKPNHKAVLGSSIRQSVFKLLDENPYFSTKMICQKLGLLYQRYRQYIWNLRNEWKTNHENEQRSKRSFHGWHGWCFVPRLDRVEAVRHGWHRTKARNRWLLWKDECGRLEWFETGRVKLWVRKPAKMGKACQLASNGFFNTGLITDVKILEKILGTIRFKGAHAVYQTDQRLPRMVIRDFEKSNGIVMKLGDSSHPKAVEVQFHYPDWVERNEQLFEQLMQLLAPKKREPEFELVDSFYIA